MLSFSRYLMMRNHVLIIFFTIFGSLANSSLALNATDTECKSIKQKLTTSIVRDYVTCHREIWLHPDMDHKNTTTALDIIVIPFTADFDEDSSHLNLRSWMTIRWKDKRLAWDPNKFVDVRYIEIPRPDIAVLSAENDDIYDHRSNRTSCHVFYDGDIVCWVPVHHKIRCHTDFTFWPYDRQNCSLRITSWSHSTDKLIFSQAKDLSPIEMDGLIFTRELNITVSRISFDLRPDYYDEKMYHPQLSIDFVVDRLHSHVKRRFVASAIIMMSMTLTALWLAPKSIERFAISSLNIIIHMMCVRDLHHALPQNSITVPNILLFYVNSFVLAILALLLTYVLEKIEDTKISIPKWIFSSIHHVLNSTAGKILLVCMLDSKATTRIETGTDGNRNNLRSGPENLNWKYVAIFFGWITFFSFFFTYVLMYALLIPNSSSRPPANVVMESYVRGAHSGITLIS